MSIVIFRRLYIIKLLVNFITILTFAIRVVRDKIHVIAVFAFPLLLFLLASGIFYILCISSFFIITFSTCIPKMRINPTTFEIIIIIFANPFIFAFINLFKILVLDFNLIKNFWFLTFAFLALIFINEIFVATFANPSEIFSSFFIIRMFCFRYHYFLKVL